MNQTITALIYVLLSNSMILSYRGSEVLKWSRLMKWACFKTIDYLASSICLPFMLTLEWPRWGRRKKECINLFFSVNLFPLEGICVTDVRIAEEPAMRWAAAIKPDRLIRGECNCRKWKKLQRCPELIANVFKKEYIQNRTFDRELLTCMWLCRSNDQ